MASSLINDRPRTAKPPERAAAIGVDARRKAARPVAAPVAGSRAEEWARRALDILVSAVALAAAAPLLLIIAAIVRLESPGPAMFAQTRIGKNRRRRQLLVTGERRRADLGGRPFTFYKFRTMYADARERFPEYYAYEHSPLELNTLPMKTLMAEKHAAMAAGPAERPKVAMGNDPRVPPFCRWLRRSSLDELPNLWNVLIGDMHLVGPRPDLPEHIQYYDARQMVKLSVKPGVTGLAQVNGRGLLTFRETLAYDLELVERRSLALDLEVLLKTIPVFVGREGAY